MICKTNSPPGLLIIPQHFTQQGKDDGEYLYGSIASELQSERSVDTDGMEGVLFDWHHIFSRTRFPWYQSDDWNLVQCMRPLHELFHQVFGISVPVEAVRFVRLFRNFVSGDSAQVVLAKLRAEFWPNDAWMETKRIDPEELKYWRAVLARKSRGKIFQAVLGERTPWQAVKLVERYFALIGEARTEEQILLFLQATFWPTVGVGQKGDIPSVLTGNSLAENRHRQGKFNPDRRRVVAYQ